MSEDRIYISICGEGFGHSSRALAIAEELIDRGCDVILGSYGYVYDYLKAQKLCKVVKVPEEIVIKGANGEFNLEKSFLITLKNVLMKTRTMVNKERDVIKKNRISCVISDGRITPIVAGGYHLGLPVLHVTNITSIGKSLLKKRLDNLLAKKPLDFVTKTTSVLCDEIIIPDFPPPNSICYYSLSDKKRIKKKTIFVGPVVKKELYTTKLIKTKKNTVLSIIGGHTYREPLVDCVVKAAGLNKNFNFIVISKLIKKYEKKDNLELMPFVDDIQPYLKSSDLIISQSGHSTLMEMICSGKTGIVIPDKKQYEQQSNARRVKEMKLFMTMNYDNLKPEILIKNLKILTEDKDYKKNVLKLSKLADRMKGSKKIADIAIEYSSRMLMKY
jgi:uncharacterized protein (TIGR00661 family)